MKQASLLSSPHIFISYIRSILFYIAVFISAILWAPVVYLALLLPIQKRDIFSRWWASYVVNAAKYICGLDYHIEGLENLPANNAILYSKHQSAWEVVMFKKEFPPVNTFILKQELLRIPIIGWGMHAFNPIAIDRGNARKALKQVIEQGTARLEQGLWVVIFPEGTRVDPGKTCKYQPGGAMLAKQSSYALIPVALNSGICWRRNSILKIPGNITIKIGTAIDPHNKTVREMNELARLQIEGMMEEISN
ncbi:MAG TPA: 1-acyl-sn-glycerol-3-phosphate acyltransferase [Crenotrichaceae bacterium]|nr:1-acyl-sn-glycerol-3-phosphate acyltransferase [Crenotrichaceae bacterium]